MVVRKAYAKGIQPGEEHLHFRVPNHGKLWNSLMRAHLGDYEQQEERLKQIAPTVKGE